MNTSSLDKYGHYALLILLTVNLLNYIDRQIIYAVFPLIKDDFGLTDTALGFPWSCLHGLLHVMHDLHSVIGR